MPYATNDDAPADVKRRFKGHCLTVWRSVWNDTFDRHQDEKRAFATAEKAGKQCEESRKMTTSVKYVKGSDSLIEGLAIPFTSPIFGGRDFDGETFTKETDFAFDWFPDGRPLLYGHGLEEGIGPVSVGRQKSHEIRDDGVWVQAQLDKRSRYNAAVSKLIENEALGFSSGSVPHLVESTSNKIITRWPWVELSLTPTPANPAAMVYPVKATDAFEHLIGINQPVPIGLKSLIDDALDDALPDGAKFADYIDRLVVDGAARVNARKDWNRKSGRVLSAATRERLAAHPDQLRVLAKDLEDLLSSADDGKSIDLQILAEMERSRFTGVPV